MSCSLCTLEKRTHWYHEDDLCIVCDCETCGPSHPMLVFKHHGPYASLTDDRHAMVIAARLGMRIARKKPKQIMDHAHYHLEKR